MQNDDSNFTREGDLIQLVGLSHKSFILTLKSGAVFHTHRGILNHDDLIGKDGEARFTVTMAVRFSSCSHQ